jgi:MFS transporter, DHA1 family, tetracycline resistance protein
VKKINLSLFKTDLPQLRPLWVAVFVDILGFSILIPFLPFFGQEFGAPAWKIGLLLSTNALFSFFSGPVWGTLSDRYGRKPMLLLSQAGTLLGFVVMAFSGSMEMMFISRIIDGIFGGNYPIAKAIIGDVAPPDRRSEEMSNIGVAHVLSSLVGPGLGGMLSHWGVLAPGLMAAALTLVAMLMTWLYLEESNPVSSDQKPGEIPIAGTVGRRAAARRLQIWQNDTARFLLVQWGFHTLSFSIYIASVSLFASLRLGLNPREMGQLLMMAGIVRVFIRFFIFVPMRRRWGDWRTSFIGLGIFIPTYVLLGFVQNQLQFAVILCLVSFGAACSRGVLNSFLSRAVQPWEQGTAMGLSASLDSFAQIIGPLLGGVVLGSLPLWVFGGITALFAAAAFGMAWRQFDFGDELAPAISEQPLAG